MSREMPPFDPPQGPEADEAALHPHRRFHLPLMAGIAGFALLTFYTSLVVAFQVIPMLWPGRQPDLGIDFGVPGVDTNAPEHASIEERINIVVLGLDQRRDEADDTPSRTDSVMILTMDPYSKKGGAFSIPRDTWLDIPDGYGGYITDRINVAYEMGEYTYKDYPGGGAGLVKDTIEHNFNIPIDYYVLLNFNNFIDLIDELGGIDIDVPEYAYDPAYNDCNACYSYPVEFLEGPEHMVGERALAYARIRASDNDFKRIERQQIVVKATARKAADLGTVFSNALDLYKQYKNAVKTDINDLQIPGLADLAQQIGPDNIRTVSMAEATYPCTSCSASVLLWNPAKVEELKARVFSADAFNEDNATVQILNGTEVPDLAHHVETLIGGRGITSDRVRTDELLDGPLYDRTLIVSLDGKEFTAEQLADWLDLPATRVVTADDPEASEFLNSSSDVVVVLGADVDLTGLEAGNSSLQEANTGG